MMNDISARQLQVIISRENIVAVLASQYGLIKVKSFCFLLRSLRCLTLQTSFLVVVSAVVLRLGHLLLNSLKVLNNPLMVLINSPLP